MSTVSTLQSGYYSENNIRYVFLDGRACNNIEDCFHSLQQQLCIPSYFGHNLDALEEVLDDLEWIPENNIKIIIIHPDALLNLDHKKKIAFISILHSARNAKIEVIYLEEGSGLRG